MYGWGMDEHTRFLNYMKVDATDQVASIPSLTGPERVVITATHKIEDTNQNGVFRKVGQPIYWDITFTGPKHRPAKGLTAAEGHTLTTVITEALKALRAIETPTKANHEH